MAHVRDRAIVLLSGGLDSATCLWWAKSRRWQPYALSFNFHGRNPKETQAAKLLAEAASVVEHRVVDLPFLREVGEGALLEGSALTEILDRVPSAYVPARNLVYYSIAANWAESIGAKWIVGGHGAIDYASFPDSTPSFFDTFNELLVKGTWPGRRRRIRVVTPLARKNKVGILRMAVKLGVPLESTWSCYGDGAKHCGRCSACQARRRAFASLRLKDPVEYETKVE